MFDNKSLLSITNVGFSGSIEELRARAATGELDPGCSNCSVKCTGMLLIGTGTIHLKDMSIYKPVITSIQPLIWYELNSEINFMALKHYDKGSAEYEQAIKGGSFPVDERVMGCFEDEGDKPKTLAGGVWLGLENNSILLIPNLT